MLGCFCTYRLSFFFNLSACFLSFFFYAAYVVFDVHFSHFASWSLCYVSKCPFKTPKLLDRRQPDCLLSTCNLRSFYFILFVYFLFFFLSLFFLSLSIYVCICLSRSLHLYLYVSVCLSLPLRTYVCCYLSVCLFIYLSLCLSIGKRLTKKLRVPHSFHSCIALEKFPKNYHCKNQQ
jgi:hypothetical protein